MLRQVITRVVVSIALICASFAWSGWVFLHSVGDPHRAERIAMSILDSADARHEIAGPITDQIIDTASLDAGTKATIRDTIASVLADPTVIDNFIAAFGSAQAQALGVDDPRPTTIDVGALTAAVRDRLAPTQPAIAALIPSTAATIDLPVVKTGAVKSLRSLAERWTNLLGLVAVVLLGVMLAVGHRRTALRSFGFWAVTAGAFWAIGPRLAPWLAHQTAPDADALVGATARAVAGPITTAATVLVIAGIISLVVCYVILGHNFGPDGATANPAGNPAAAQGYSPSYATAAVPATAPTMGPMTGGVFGSDAHRFSYGLTRTDEVPVYVPATGQAPYQAPYQAPRQGASQPRHMDQTQYQDRARYQPPPAAFAPPVAPHRSTPIDALLADDSTSAGNTFTDNTFTDNNFADDTPAAPFPLVVRPLDLPSSREVLFPLTGPAFPTDEG